MSTITVLVGQCGNQLGTAYLSSIAEEALDSTSESYQQSVSSTFFRTSAQTAGGTGFDDPAQQDRHLPHARCVLVDMEPKVVTECVGKIKRSGKFTLSPKQCVTKEEGSANNWAFGYNAQGPTRLEAVVESLRREAEASCSVSTFHVMHGVAGGTGSGVGCLLADAIRTEYPHSLLMHTVVWPFSHGEIMTQWYNCLLAMQHLHTHADSICVLSNDDVSSMLRRATGGSRGGTQQPSFDDINFVMGGYLSGLYLPRMLMEVPPPEAIEKRSKLLQKHQHPTALQRLQQKSHHQGAPESSSMVRPANAADIVEAVALDPQRKIFECESVPLVRPGLMTSHLRNVSWPGILPEALRLTRSPMESSLLVLRGAKVLTEGIEELQNCMASSMGTTPYGESRFAPPMLNGLHCSSVSFRNQQAYAALYRNADSFAPKMEHCLTKVESMIDAGAFVHHFDRYGVTQDDFEDAQLCGWQLAAAYGSDIDRVS